MLPRGRFLTVPNLLSVSRLVLLPLFIWAVDRPEYLWLAIGLAVWGVLSDLADGYIARRFDQRSEWGLILDPVADKVVTFVVLGYCYLSRGLPLWFLLLVAGRDLAILLASPFLAQRKGDLPASNWVGRIAALSVAVVAVSYVFQITPLRLPALAAAVVLVLLSSARYTQRLFQHAD